MEPPSKPLLHTLRTLRLCTPADLRRCRRRVGQLARDLPTFDSLWVDALLHLRRITPFQARVIQSARPEALRIGPCVLVDQLSHRRTATTYLARRIDGIERCVLKVTDPPDATDALERLHRLAARGRATDHPGAVAPHQCLSHEGQVVLISRPIDGPTLGDLLVRRGRFPAAVVFDLAAQLIDALAALEEAGIVHGDVRLGNARLTPRGQAVLVDAGVKPALLPELTIHAALPPEHYDGTAPELIGTGRPPTSASDVYALGCLLWQLLAGRPVFATGDPLARLAAHQTKPVPDVRDRAPDTPARLADAIRAFTQRDPRARPQSFRDLRACWGPPRKGCQRRLARFRRQFVTSAPAATAPAASGGNWWPSAVAALLLLTGLSLTLVDLDARATVLSLKGRAAEWLTESPLRPPSRQVGPASHDSEPAKPLPPPDSRGVIELRDAGPWEAAHIAAVGPLAIRAPQGVVAEIPITTRTLTLRAERVIVENVRFVDCREGNAGPDDPGRPAPTALLSVTARHVAIRGCTFDSRDAGAQSAAGESRLDVLNAGNESRRPVPALLVRPLEAAGRRSARVQVQDAVFLGDAPAIDGPSDLALDARNVLHVGSGSFVGIERPVDASRELRIILNRVTLRGSRALIEIPMTADRTPGRTIVEATDSVLGLGRVADAGATQAAEGSATDRDVRDLVESAGLFRLLATDLPAGWTGALEVSGDGSLLGQGVEIAVQQSTDGVRRLDASDVAVEGLTTGPFDFAGAPSERPADSVIRSWSAPRRSPTPPGIVPTAWGRPR